MCTGYVPNKPPAKDYDPYKDREIGIGGNVQLHDRCCIDWCVLGEDILAEVFGLLGNGNETCTVGWFELNLVLSVGE